MIVELPFGEAVSLKHALGSFLALSEVMPSLAEKGNAPQVLEDTESLHRCITDYIASAKEEASSIELYRKRMVELPIGMFDRIQKLPLALIENDPGEEIMEVQKPIDWNPDDDRNLDKAVISATADALDSIVKITRRAMKCDRTTKLLMNVLGEWNTLESAIDRADTRITERHKAHIALLPDFMEEFKETLCIKQRAAGNKLQRGQFGEKHADEARRYWEAIGELAESCQKVASR